MSRRKLRFQIFIVLAPLLLIAATPTDRSMEVAAVFIILGSLLRVWANGCVKKTEELCTWGPYAYVRNPLYLGTILVSIGFAILSMNLVLGILLVLGLFYAYRQTIMGEEKDLLRLFPEDYKKYFASVPRLIPRLTPYKSGSHGKFIYKRFSENWEIKNTLWIILFFICFYFKKAFINEKQSLNPINITVICVAVLIIILESVSDIFRYRQKRKNAAK